MDAEPRPDKMSLDFNKGLKVRNFISSAQKWLFPGQESISVCFV